MGRSRFITATALAASVCIASSVLAEDSLTASRSALDRPPIDGIYPLSLSDAIALGLTNNLQVEVERYAPLIALQDRDAAWGAYDPEVFAEFGYSAIEEPIASSLQTSSSVETYRTDGAGGVKGLLPYLGASYEVALSGDRNASNRSTQSLSPQLTSGLTISGSIPLMRGLLWNDAWTNVKSSAVRYDSSEEVFRTQVMNIVQDIANSYWNLVARKEQLRVAERSVETAKALLDQTETQYEVGVVSKVDVVEAEAGLAERDFDLIVADNAYRNAQDALIDIVLGPYLTATSKLTFLPSDDPEGYTVFQVDVEDSVRQAFSKRPELAVARKNVENNEIQRRYAKNQRLPQLDIQGSYGFRGLAGDPNSQQLNFGGGGPSVAQGLNDTLIPDINNNFQLQPGGNEIPAFQTDPAQLPAQQTPEPQVGDDFNDTFDDYFKSKGADQFTVRGVFSIPFPNTTARKRATIAELELRRSKTRIIRQEQTIILEVREAVRNLTSALRGIEAAERRRVASQEQVRAERVRLEHGESTPFDVLQRERDLTEAESQKIVALQRYRDSVTSLDRSRGTILEARNVEIDAVRSRSLTRY